MPSAPRRVAKSCDIILRPALAMQYSPRLIETTVADYSLGKKSCTILRGETMIGLGKPSAQTVSA